jgi:hypothetical protein
MDKSKNIYEKKNATIFYFFEMMQENFCKFLANIVTSPFLIPKLPMYIVNTMYDHGRRNVICKHCIEKILK